VHRLRLADAVHTRHRLHGGECGGRAGGGGKCGVSAAQQVFLAWQDGSHQPVDVHRRGLTDAVHTRHRLQGGECGGQG
jgi:hypothetical protein